MRARCGNWASGAPAVAQREGRPPGGRRLSALPLEIFVRRGFPHALKPLDARRRLVFLLVQLGTGDAKLFRRVDGHGKDLARLEEFDDDIRPYGNVVAGTNRQ